MSGAFHIGRLRHVNDGVAHAPTIRRLEGGDWWEESQRQFEEMGIPREQYGAIASGRWQATPPRQLPTPVGFSQRTQNALRPATLSAMIGQERMRALLQHMVQLSNANGRVLDHVLLVGPAGTGKSTIANAIANELGADCYQLEAPVGHDTLLDLREVCQRGDIVFIDEIHQQSAGDRRGRTNNTTPEVFLGVLEDRTLVSGSGVLDFPEVTFIGATTDEGQLPDAFISRFPIRPVFEPYNIDDLKDIAEMNAAALGKRFPGSGAILFAQAARLTPRVVNNYVKNAAGLAVGDEIDDDLVHLVLADLNGVAEDGLTIDQQRLLGWLLHNGKRTTKSGTTYQASVSTLATAIGKGRDTKSIVLRVEPWLLASGLLSITSGGRALTDKGIKRARQI